VKHSILIVEDNVGVAAPMAEYLERGGYEIRTLPSAAEAKLAIHAKNYSLVITDLRMETGKDSDGLEFIRYLKKVKPGLPVFILTASGSSDAATEGVRLLVSKFLEKPISMPSLLATIRKFLEEFYGGA
jgi:DNA-binding NtrC family response regulator